MITKTQAHDLAIFGGSPAFSEPYHVGRPNLGDRDRLFARLDDLLDRRWLTNFGAYSEELERRIADLAGVEHCIAVTNGTIGLELAIRALGLTGEVIVPSFTFIATAHALSWVGIKPVFCDVDRHTHNLDPGRVEELIGPATTGILGVHLWGRACDVDALGEIARRRGLKLLFDAAHAFGSTWGGKPVGGFGDAEVFSFHATKCLNSFEGGAVLTNDGAIAAKVRQMQNFGFTDYGFADYTVEEIGTNGKMTEAAAAMGLTSLESLDQFVAANRRNYGRYRQGLAGVPGVTVMAHDQAERGTYHYVVTEIDGGEQGPSRDELFHVLWAENVRARRYFHPGCHRALPYRSLVPDVARRLPSTELLCQRVLCLPTGTTVSAAVVDDICELMRFVMRQGPAVREALAHESLAR